MALAYLKQMDSLWQLLDCIVNWLNNCFIPDTQVIFEDVTNEEILTINNFIVLLGITCGGSPCMHVGTVGFKIWVSYFVHIKVAYQLSFLDMLLVMSMKIIRLIAKYSSLVILTHSLNK